ncbi:GDP dissociation inhibitor [Gracilaria domingensis]|nr:GDP dissociation inhibitor [Gracilaria domingensis]
MLSLTMPTAAQPQPLTETGFDVVVIGTDLPQAILAAALSISGSRVLHLDANDFYGGQWATTQVSLLENAIQEVEQDANGETTSPPPVIPGVSMINNHFPDHGFQPFRSMSLYDQIFPLGARRLQRGHSSELRSFTASCLLDLVPRPIMSEGNMIELLVRTNVGHYVDFRAIDALYVQFPGSDGLQRVPGSRADVFQNSFITMPEKRLMMRYVTRCYETILSRKEQFQGDENFTEKEEDDVSLQEDMDAMRLTPKLQTFLTHSILFSVGEKQFSKTDGMDRVYHYQASVMRFGTKTPFLYPNFGTGELSQAFCRLCAVHGGTYVLRRGATGLVRPRKGRTKSPPEDCEYRLGVITTAGDIVRTRYVFMPGALLKKQRENAVGIWHAVVVLDGSILKANEPERAMITIPRGAVGNYTSAVRVRQVDGAVMVCPQGIFIVYAETIEEDGREQDLIRVLESYIVMSVEMENKQETGSDSQATNQSEADSRADVKPNCLWGISYARPRVKSETFEDGVVLVAANEREHDAENAVLEAQRCFKIVHPDREFLPKRKNESEIVSNGSVHSEKERSEIEEQGI